MLRNRIIAGVVIVLAIVLFFNLGTCIARAISGSQSESASSPTVGASASAASASAGAAPSTNSAAASGDPASPVQAVASAASVQTKGVEDPWVPSGRFTTGDAELDQLVKDHCDRNSSPDRTQAENAKNAYCFAIWAEFIERDDNQHPKVPNWDVTYAKQIMTEGGGNCYEQVAIGEYILKYFGYSDAQGEPCFILRQSGSYGEHGLLYVTDLDGRKCLCDPAFGSDGWMLDADVYTVQLMDIGQDPAEFSIANFEDIVKAPWVDA